MAKSKIASAYIQLIPSADGFADAINSQIGGASGIVAQQSNQLGQEAGEETTEGAKKGMSGFGKVMGGIVAAGVGSALVGLKGLYSIGEVFDDVSDTIRVGTGLSGDALADLEASAINIGKTIPAEFTAVGSTVADLNTRLGLSGPVLEKIASQYLEAGRILGEEIDIGSTTAAFSAFKIEGEAVSGAMDSLFRVSQATGVGMNELAGIVGDNAPAMQNLGFSFDETASLAGTLDKAGIDAAGTLKSMGKGLITLAKDGEEPQAAFRRVTSEIQALVDQGNTAAALDLASGIFGSKAANSFVGALQSGTVALDDLVAGTGASADDIISLGEETQDAAEKMQILKNKASAALEPLGSAVFGKLGEILSDMIPKLEAFSNWISNNSWAITAFAIAIGTLLVGAFVGWAASIWAANAALLANPITWIVLGVAALIAGIVLLVMNWDSVTEAIGRMASAVSNWIGETWGAFSEWISGLRDGLVGALSDAGNAVGGFFSGIGSSIASGLSTAWNAIGSFFSGIGDWWVSLYGRIQENVIGILSSVGDAFANVGNGIKGAFQGVGNFIIGIVNLAISGINALIRGLNGIDVKAPSWIPGIGGKSWGVNMPTIPNIPALATGAEITGPTLAMIGEKDPEYVVNRGVMNSTLEALTSRLEGGAGLGAEINIYQQPGESTAELAERIANYWKWESRV